MNREDCIRRVIRNSTRIAVETMLRSQENSDAYLTRWDKQSIDEEVDRVTEAVIDKFVAALSERGFTKEGEQVSGKEFDSLFQSTVQQYLEEMGRKKA